MSSRVESIAADRTLLRSEPGGHCGTPRTDRSISALPSGRSSSSVTVNTTALRPLAGCTSNRALVRSQDRLVKFLSTAHALHAVRFPRANEQALLKTAIRRVLGICAWGLVRLKPICLCAAKLIVLSYAGKSVKGAGRSEQRRRCRNPIMMKR